MGFGRGFGSLPFGYQAPSSTSGEAVRLHSARKIDALTRRYEFESTGEFKAMNGSSQRVLLTVASVMHASVKPSSHAMVDSAKLAQIEQDLTAELTSTVGDAITLEGVSARRAVAGAVAVEVTFRDNGTGKIQTAAASI